MTMLVATRIKYYQIPSRKIMFLDEHFSNPKAVTERCSLKNVFPKFQKQKTMANDFSKILEKCQ